MGLFYHALGLVLMQLGSQLVTNVMPEYETPQIPVSISLALSSGLLEESVFFGIPFYLTGNSFVLLGTGIVWSVSHLFNSGTFSLESLAYGGFLFSVPHIFFSLRTWSSGKGWFAIVFHSVWNFIILISYCSFGLRQCSIINDNTFDLMNIITAISAGTIVYLAYQNYANKKNINRYIYLIPVSITIILFFVLFSNEIIFLN